jgi:hypothetical protein
MTHCPICGAEVECPSSVLDQPRHLMTRSSCGMMDQQDRWKKPRRH